MAMIVATYDSETKKIQVTVDGVDQGDITHFSCYSNCCEEEDEEEGEYAYGGCQIEKKRNNINGVTYCESAYANTKTDREKLELYFKNALSRK